MVSYDLGDVAEIELIFQNGDGEVGVPDSAKIIYQNGDGVEQYYYWNDFDNGTSEEINLFGDILLLKHKCNWAGRVKFRVEATGDYGVVEPFEIVVVSSNISAPIDAREDDTGLFYYPHYLNVGNITEPNYYRMQVHEIDLGELTDIMSKKEILDLTTDSVKEDRPNRDRVLAAVQSAESEFDSYVCLRYSIPVRNRSGLVPREVKNKVKHLFRYFMYSRRASMMPDIRRSYEDILRYLESVARGRASIPELEINPETHKATDVTPSRTIIGEVHRGTTFWGDRRRIKYGGRINSFDDPGF